MRQTFHRSGIRRVRRNCVGRGVGVFAFTLVELVVVLGVVTLLASWMIPAWARGRGLARSTQCMHQLRQLALAVQIYTDNHGGTFPPAYWFEVEQGVRYAKAWDFTLIEGNPVRILPGLLWEGQSAAEIHQCPEYRGPANWGADPYTGYNYNTSYLGHGQFESIPEPAQCAQVRHPAATVVFGDGQYGGGANKFMRAPWPNPGDASFRGRWAGTQGFRHCGRTGAAFVDGHVEALRRRFAENADGAHRVAAGTGFLSPDNGLYDLE
ncbi:MAG: DUF1559 domain-containing protein [Verrucomicrobiota bacterium]|nr:DUF1559 domain-containing protein [Limisphaera sp.]MDW8381203.1 DUF1559 domain-containing protein [Verrucomicrobiota bacterium]